MFSTKEAFTRARKNKAQKKIFKKTRKFNIPKSLKPDVINLGYIKPGLFYLTEFTVSNFRGLQHRAAEV